MRKLKNKEEKNNKTKKPLYKRVWFIAVAVLVIAISLAALSMPFAYGVQTVILRIACIPRNISTPLNYQEISDNTSVTYDIEYTSSYDNNYMDIISPSVTSGALPLFVYFHGGYYVAGDKKGAEPYLRMVANEGYIVANVNYALVPEEKYPAQVIQANEAIKYLREVSDTYNIDSSKIFIGGDSAGSHLSGQLGAVYTNASLLEAVAITPALTKQELKGVILLCGFFNFMTVRESGFPFLNDAMWMLTGVKKYESYERAGELNTIDNVTENYPSTYLLCGSDDPFYVQNTEMKQKLESKGVAVTEYLPISTKYKLNHEFQRDFELEEAYTAMDLLTEFLAENSI